MSKVFVREYLPTVDRFWLLDMKLREADRREFEASSGRTGNEPVVEAADSSAVCRVAIIDGQIVAVWGVVDVGDEGVVWACGTDAMTEYPLTLRAEAEKFFRHCLEKWSALIGAVDSRNTVHIHWLKRHHFLITENVAVLNDVPFHFIRRTKSCAIQ